MFEIMEDYTKEAELEGLKKEKSRDYRMGEF